MSKPRRQFLRGDDLLKSLAFTNPLYPVKWLVGDQRFFIPPDQAICIAKASSYEGQFKNGRVYFIREVITRPIPVFDPAYRYEKPVLQVLPLDKNVTKIWDRFFATHTGVKSSI